ncbi:uncharacterized protein isoform X1 [Leptinotarsa decemlineata]|uniref:uncharacterized protein isoform X1 n=1 Tax=Leptinotarsa decemlineata TaxID=7539 RepID=UPI003D305C9A
MAHSIQGDQNRTIIIPKGVLNPDQVNIINIPRRLNTTAPLLVTPRKEGGFKSQTLPIWKDELSEPGPHGCKSDLEVKPKACSSRKGDYTTLSSMYDSSAEMEMTQGFAQGLGTGEYNIVKPMTPSPERPWPKLPEHKMGKGFKPRHMSSPQPDYAQQFSNDTSFPSTIYSQQYSDFDTSASTKSSSADLDCLCPSEEEPDEGLDQSPIPNATYNQPPYSSTFSQPQQPQNVNATFNRPLYNSTFNQPQNVNETFNRPLYNSTFNQPQNVNETFNQPLYNSTFNQPQNVNETFNRPLYNSTFSQPQNVNETFNRPLYNSTFNQPQNVNETFNQPLSNSTFNQPQNVNATFNPSQTVGYSDTYAFDENCICPQHGGDGSVYDKTHTLKQTYGQYGGGQFPGEGSSFAEPYEEQYQTYYGGGSYCVPPKEEQSYYQSSGTPPAQQDQRYYQPSGTPSAHQEQRYYQPSGTPPDHRSGGGPSQTIYQTPLKTPRRQNMTANTTYLSTVTTPGAAFQSPIDSSVPVYQSCTNMQEDPYSPRIVHMSSRTFSQTNDDPPESQSVTVDAPEGIDEPALRYATQMATFGDSSYFADESYSSQSPPRNRRSNPKYGRYASQMDSSRFYPSPDFQEQQGMEYFDESGCEISCYSPCSNKTR